MQKYTAHQQILTGHQWVDTKLQAPKLNVKAERLGRLADAAEVLHDGAPHIRLGPLLVLVKAACWALHLCLHRHEQGLVVKHVAL